MIEMRIIFIVAKQKPPGNAWGSKKVIPMSRKIKQVITLKKVAIEINNEEGSNSSRKVR